MRNRYSQLKLIPDQAFTPRAVNHITSPYNMFAVPGTESYAALFDFKRIDGRLLSDVAPGFGGMIEEDSVEFGSEDLISSRPLRLKSVPKIKANALAASGDDLATVLDQKAAVIHFLSNSHPLQGVQRGRQRRLSDTEARELLLLENDDASVCLCQKS